MSSHAGLNNGTILQVRWWHEADLRSESRSLDRVVRAVRRSLADAGIGMATPEIRVTGDTSVTEHHDEEEQ